MAWTQTFQPHPKESPIPFSFIIAANRYGELFAFRISSGPDKPKVLLLSHQVNEHVSSMTWLSGGTQRGVLVLGTNKGLVSLLTVSQALEIHSVVQVGLTEDMVNVHHLKGLTVCYGFITNCEYMAHGHDMIEPETPDQCATY